jgi:hypothetical protein
MTDRLRTLSDAGIAQFAGFLASIRAGGKDPVPYFLLTDDQTSSPMLTDVNIDRKPFADRFAFGEYLVSALQPLDRREIANSYSLWTWLALYFFDDICPLVNGNRNVLEDAVYILDKVFNHQRYYRHLVRTPWLIVSDHGANAKVMLIMRDKGSRSEIFEQLAARQDILGNPTVIGGAYRLYFDPTDERPKRGSGGKGAGSPRRLSAVVQQLDLTYDLHACTVEQFLALLPSEFDSFKATAQGGQPRSTATNPSKGTASPLQSSASA